MSSNHVRPLSPGPRWWRWVIRAGGLRDSSQGPADTSSTGRMSGGDVLAHNRNHLHGLLLSISAATLSREAGVDTACSRGLKLNAWRSRAAAATEAQSAEPA